MQRLRLEIVTPDGVVYSKMVDYVAIPTQTGEIGVYPAHAPLFTLISEGELVVRHTDGEDRILITGGCAEVRGDSISVLTVFATDERQLDEERAEEARRRAEERLKEADRLSPEEQALVQAALAHSLAQLRLKRRGRRQGSMG